VRAELRAHGLRIAIDDSADKLGAKIRNARLMRIPYIAVVGEKEVETEAVAPKTGDGTDLGPMPVAQFLARLLAEAKPPRPAKQGS
jgi:threonyl-tRNA synthetase